MNLYFLSLLEGCKTSRREITRKGWSFFLPNGKLEGMILSTGRTNFYKNGKPRLKCNYGPRRYIFVNIPRSGITLNVSRGDYEFSFLVPGFKFPFEVQTGIDRFRRFNSVLYSFDLPNVSLLTKGRNFTLRTLTSTFIDGLMID